MARQPKMRRASRAVRVGATSCGQGVIARRSFRADEVVGEISGTVVADPDYWSEYSIEFGEGAALEPAPPFRFLNHSCEPNCQLLQRHGWNSDDDAHCRVVILVALQGVASGEQLTIDYGWNASSAIPCACGALSCRGWIIEPAELPNLIWAGPTCAPPAAELPV